MSKIIPGAKNSYFCPAFSMAISTKATLGGAAGGGKPTKTINSDAKNAANKFIFWGSDNKEPQKMIKAIRDNELIYPVIEKRAQLLYGEGIAYGPIEINDEGHAMIKRQIIPEIEDFLENTNANIYIQEAAIDNAIASNFYPEILLNEENPKKVKGIYCNDFTECRVAAQNAQGIIPKVLVNANWLTDGDYDNSTKIDALDMYGDMVQQMADKPEVNKWCIPIFSQSLGEKFYAVEAWRGLRNSGWLDIAASIPKWKRAVMKNQIAIKYHLQIDTAYWEATYPGFEEMKPEEKTEIQKEEIETFLDTMQGEDKAGNVLMTSMTWEEAVEKHRPSWSIEALPGGKFEDNNNLEYAGEADRRIIRAFGLHPSLFGAGAGKGSAGSGSDIRVATNQAILAMRYEQDRIMLPFNLAARINGWNEKYGGENKKFAFWCASYYIARLDQGKEISGNPDGHSNNSQDPEE